MTCPGGGPPAVALDPVRPPATTVAWAVGDDGAAAEGVDTLPGRLLAPTPAAGGGVAIIAGMGDAAATAVFVGEALLGAPGGVALAGATGVFVGRGVLAEAAVGVLVAAATAVEVAVGGTGVFVAATVVLVGVAVDCWLPVTVTVPVVKVACVRSPARPASRPASV